MNHEIHEIHEKFYLRRNVFNYLKATGLKLGLIVNFGHYPKAQVERIIL